MTDAPTASDRRAERAAFEEDAEDLYENAPCGYVSSAPDGRIVRVNRTFLDWTGYEAEDLVGRKRFHDLLTPGGRIYYETHYAPLLHMQRRVREIAVDIVRADGSRLPALVNAVLKTAPDGAPLVIRATVLDARERREYERELLRERDRAEESEARARELAQTLQASLIPPALPRIPGLDIAGVYRPAGRGDEVGGDFYDVFESGRGEWAVVVGDVAGKGAEAATVTALIRYTARAAAAQSRRPHVVLSAVNQALLRDDSSRFATMVHARVRVERAGEVRLTVGVAGHPLPLRATSGGNVVPIGRPGSLLGALDDATVNDETVALEPGDLVVLYTDGVTEARGSAGFYGEERLEALLREVRDLDAAAAARRIVDEVTAFQGELPRDDIAVVALKPASPA